MVSLLEVPAGARVLDVGTGTGVAARAALEAVGPDGLAVGVDSSMPMLRRAARGDRVRYTAALAIDLPFRDATFDAVTMAFVVSFFRRYETALFDVMRVLRRGGRMGVATWGAREDEFQRAWREVCWEFVDRGVLAEALTEARPWEDRFRDPDALKAALHDAGLRDILISRREYRFLLSAEEYLLGRQTATSGRFLRSMLGEEAWERLRRRSREVFAERFPERFYDFRDVNVAVGFKA
jgi:ubiquinone/menaquinone biosynthesis C-methylase UbiE